MVANLSKAVQGHAAVEGGAITERCTASTEIFPKIEKFQNHQGPSPISVPTSSLREERAAQVQYRGNLGILTCPVGLE
jgi:hypothetical protein